jgi:hypothetical protein
MSFWAVEMVSCFLREEASSRRERSASRFSRQARIGSLSSVVVGAE